MSSICGIYYKRHGSPEVGFHDLSAMLHAPTLPKEAEPILWTRGSVGFGTVKLPYRDSFIAERMIGSACVALVGFGDFYSVSGRRCDPTAKPGIAQTLLELYLKEGIDGVGEVRGEFALAIWDDRSGTLDIVTDRFRVCPIFYYEDEEKLVFASHVKGILHGPNQIRRRINPKAIIDLIAYSSVATPDTIFQDIRKLAPGHYLSCGQGSTRLKAYWDINFARPQPRSAEDLIAQLKEVLLEAVSLRYQRDKETNATGAFLSGGIDSSTVNGLLAGLAKGPVKSFSIGFQEQPFNEIEYARIAAKHFNLDHYEYFVSPRDVLESIPLIVGTFDEPYANASAIPTYFCAKLAREQGIRILYAGDGGDELFAGNERYATERLFRYYSDLPGWIRRGLIEPVVLGLDGWLALSATNMAKKYIRRASIPNPRRITSYGIFNEIRLEDYFELEFLESLGNGYDPYGPVCQHYEHAGAKTELDRHLYIDLKMTISDNDLFKVNRMTEAVGVVARYPFLDHCLAEFAATVPAAMKMTGIQLRTFFKKAYADLLPTEIIKKKKHGFGLPIAGWLRSETKLNEMLHDLVLSPQSLQRGYFRRDALSGLMKRHQTETSSYYGTILWNAMVLEMWHRANG